MYTLEVVKFFYHTISHISHEPTPSHKSITQHSHWMDLPWGGWDRPHSEQSAIYFSS